MTNYKCRSCGEEMQKSGYVLFLKQSNKVIGRIEVHRCKKCVIFLKEYIMNCTQKELDNLKNSPLEIEQKFLDTFQNG